MDLHVFYHKGLLEYLEVFQYLLTLFVNHKQFTNCKINNNMGEMGEYYKHHFGKTKFQNPLVSDTKIHNPLSIKNLI